MITKTSVHKAFVDEKKGWAFSVYYDDREYPNLKSALYKTKKEAEKQLQRYLNTGKFDFYGDAE